MRFLLTSFIGFSLLGCATVPIENAFIDYEIFDNENESKIELSYKNKTRKTICMSTEEWPNQAGKIHQPSDSVFLNVAGKTIPMTDFNTGHCIGSLSQCAHVVKPGETITGFLSYDDFKLPKNLHTSQKSLSYSPPSFFCK